VKEIKKIILTARINLIPTTGGKRKTFYRGVSEEREYFPRKLTNFSPVYIRYSRGLNRRGDILRDIMLSLKAPGKRTSFPKCTPREGARGGGRERRGGRAEVEKAGEEVADPKEENIDKTLLHYITPDARIASIS